MHFITDEQIEVAKQQTQYSGEVFHEHNDCIRIAYEWLDAQVIIRRGSDRIFQLKSYIERWAGRYVSIADVEVAAQLHPNISGTYPRFNLSVRFTEPSVSRLHLISEANTQDYRIRHNASLYTYHEPFDYQ
ncbi:hypothetical protein I6Y99_004927 [Vibrio parahaemolyticus]|nr:hypothetical protein [Vibrio parahaemolyticus]EGQ7810860.1 hypothetical protein [Vibrio parahaemolyticus]MBE4804883.1 hypothetical protein [Vibrio parahaemolyticus]MCR9864460.1 hypothetical protein [Vibrio parahaemolyticus]MDF4628350.1 hypothetical protein [Vibrio parahaemolyticus]OUJ39271.1 hypothetical protein BTZ05_21810 [Vibrio parahaemolyticus]